MQSLPNMNLPPGTQPMAPQQYSGAPIPSFVSPSMWQESVASEGGLKREWINDYDDGNINPMSKRPRRSVGDEATDNRRMLNGFTVSA